MKTAGQYWMDINTTGPLCGHNRSLMARLPLSASGRKETKKGRLEASLFRRYSDQSAASFSFFKGRTFTLTEAGLAANHWSWPVKGFLPKRFFVAGT